MKHSNFYTVLLLITFFLGSCGSSTLPTPNPKTCADYWSQVNIPGFCGIDFNSQFNVLGDFDFCKANSNDSYPHDDQIWFTYGNLYEESLAQQEYDGFLDEYSGDPGFQTLSGIGDEAFTTRSLNGYGDVTYISIYARKAVYTLILDVNIGHSEDICMTESMSYQMAEALLSNL